MLIFFVVSIYFISFMRVQQLQLSTDTGSDFFFFFFLFAHSIKQLCTNKLSELLSHNILAFTLTQTSYLV